MYLTNWLAKNGGLAFPSEMARGNVRLYGNVYGHPEFPDGEFVQTATVVSFTNGVARTASGSEYRLGDKAPQYLNYLQAVEKGLMVLKRWGVKDGLLVGIELDGTPVSGRVKSQSFNDNICRLEDGRLLFVDWLSKGEYAPEIRADELVLFCTEKCMPDIIGKHFGVFKRHNTCNMQNTQVINTQIIK